MPQNSANGEPEPPPKAELRIGNDPDEPPHLSFKITTLYENQKPSADAPFHVKGGEWTFFDCQASNDPNVVFTVGVEMGNSSGKTPVAWGNAVLAVKDREAGGRFVELFSKAFSGKLPTPMQQAQVPGRLSIKTAVLGHHMDREAQGGFSGGVGGWTATKWFPEHDGRSGEVYFNFDLTNRRGEFSEKDADYADDLAAIFVSAFRDGPRPERTPANDPNLSLIGPSIGQPRKLLSRLSASYSFSPKDRFVVYQDRSTILALPLDQPEGKPREIVRFDHSPWEVRLLNEGLDLLVQEGIPERADVKSSADPMRIWWVNGQKKTKRLLRGPEKDLGLAEAAVSPDHRYVALDQWRANPGGKGRSKFQYILDRESGKEQTLESAGKELTVVGWEMTEAGLRAVALTNRWRFNKDEVSELYLADPATGKLERQQTTDPRHDIDNRLSPDGKRRVRIGKEELIVTDVSDGEEHRFRFHPDDLRFVEEECIEWVSPRYLKFNGPKLALIDVTTMKMCFPVSADGVRFGSHSYKFSPDGRWVLYQGEGADGEGLFLAPVESPKAP